MIFGAPSHSHSHMNPCRIGAQGSQIIWCHLAHGPRKRNKYASFPYGSYLPNVHPDDRKTPPCGAKKQTQTPKLDPKWLKNFTFGASKPTQSPSLLSDAPLRLEAKMGSRPPIWSQEPTNWSQNNPETSQLGAKMFPNQPTVEPETSGLGTRSHNTSQN